MNRIASLFAPVALSAAMAPINHFGKRILEPVYWCENKRAQLLSDLIVSPQAPLKMLCKKISSFAALQDNWAGEGSVPPSTEAIYNATHFLSSLDSNYVAHLNIDDIVPSPYGTLSFEWVNKKQDYLCVEVGDTEIGYFYKMLGKEATSEDDVFFSNENATRQIEYLLGDLYEVVDEGRVHTA